MLESVIRQLLEKTPRLQQHRAQHFAPANVALSKYWGKRCQRLNLPVSDSLSISLANLGTHTCVELVDNDQDRYSLNGHCLDFNHPMYHFLAALREASSIEACFSIVSHNTIPTACGLASSASAYAALVLAMNQLLESPLSSSKLSILARLGSGSACRSLWHGFVLWEKGTRDDGMDSHAHLLNTVWPDLRVGLLLVDPSAKAISSRTAMQACVDSSPFYTQWPQVCQRDVAVLQTALTSQDFVTLGSCSESNALAMHAVMHAARPAINYWQASTLAAIQRVWELREQGLNLYFTQDAGPNLKLLFLDQNTPEVQAAFPDLIIVSPFACDKVS